MISRAAEIETRVDRSGLLVGRLDQREMTRARLMAEPRAPTATPKRPVQVSANSGDVRITLAVSRCAVIR
jgi:hypothetical protein